MSLTVWHRVAGHQEVDTGGTSPMTDQRHVSWIPTEVSDVLLHPVQRRDLIHQAVIRRWP